MTEAPLTLRQLIRALAEDHADMDAPVYVHDYRDGKWRPVTGFTTWQAGPLGAMQAIEFDLDAEAPRADSEPASRPATLADAAAGFKALVAAAAAHRLNAPMRTDDA